MTSVVTAHRTSGPAWCRIVVRRITILAHSTISGDRLIRVAIKNLSRRVSMNEYSGAFTFNRRLISSAALMVICWTCLLCAARAETAVTLAWDQSNDFNIAGYCVYAREENSSTPTRINVGAATLFKIGGLKEGLRYAFTVTAYNASGIESIPSNEVIYTVPVPLRIAPPPLATGFMKLQFPAAPGHWYEMQASSDLQTWATIWQTGVANTYSWVEYQDPQSRTLKRRHYRLVIH